MRCASLVVLLYSLGTGSTLAQVTLNVETILNKPEAGGVLRIALCPSKEAFNKDVGCRLLNVAPSGRSVRCSFEDVLPGVYAVKVFHDLNVDNVLNTSWVGWPQEPYGFSNNAPVNAGPPSFKLAAIEVKDKDFTTRIALR